MEGQSIPLDDASIYLIAFIVIALFIFYLVRLLGALTSPFGAVSQPLNLECNAICTEEDAGTVRRVILFGYITTFIALVTPLVPPLLVASDSAILAYSRSIGIGIVVGCQAQPDGRVIGCGENPKGQWLVNIGGSIGPYIAEDDPDGKLAARYEAGRSEVGRAIQSRIENSDLCLETAKDDADKLKQCQEANAALSREVRELVASWKPAPRVYAVDGGLAVPLYLIVISILGAAVGIARRLPEFQRRGSRTYIDLYLTWEKAGKQPENAPLPMDAAQVREAVVFQIMQVFSAPLVAITAYAVFGPENTSTTVLIAFASGFSTEAILLLIRKGVEQLGGYGGGSKAEKPQLTTAATAAAGGAKPESISRRSATAAAAAAAAKGTTTA